MALGLEGKRLLLLGGIRRACVIVERARQLGIHVAVADYYEDSPAKLVADEGVLIDATDVESLVSYCKENHIDGVMTAYVDALLPACAAVADGADLPCYMTEDMLVMSLNKDMFKAVCSEHGVPVPRTYSIDRGDIEYPAFVKPLDASGSRGASLCQDPSELDDAVRFALSSTKGGGVVVEQFLTGTEFILDYIIQDGQPMLLSMADRYTTEGRSEAINHPNLMIFPSKNLEEYRGQIDFTVRRMFEDLSFRDGLVFMQGYVGEGVAFYEMGCRLGGTWPYIVEHFTGVNPMDLLFRHALTGSMCEQAIEVDPNFDGYGANIYFLCKEEEAELVQVTGVEEVRELSSTVCVIQYHFAGEHLSRGNSTDILLLAVHIVSDTFAGIKSEVNRVYSMVDFLDEEGMSILEPNYDTNLLVGYQEKG